MMNRMLDVSNHQRDIDWAQVATSGIIGVFMKASEGTDYADAYLAANMAGTKANGFQRGFYHFALPFGNAPEDEADWFLSCIEKAGGLEDDDLLALDMEAGAPGTDLLNWVRCWKQRVRARTGVTPILYSGRWFMGPHGMIGTTPAHHELAAMPLWIADYGSVVPAPPEPWRRLLMWQHTSSAQYLGISGNVDENIVYATVEELRGLGYRRPVGEVMDKGRVDAMLGSLWGWKEALRPVVKPEIIKEMEDAINAIKEEAARA